MLGDVGAMQIVPVQNVNPVQVQQPSVRTLFVRVLSAEGDGSFIVSAGGNRISVRSEANLSVGQTFVASVRSDQSGRVILTPVPDSNFGEMPAPGTSESLLYAQGDAVSGLAYRVLQFMEQSGMKIDRSLMEKAVSVGKRFPGKERLASEAAAILLQKGIVPNDDEVLALMSMSVGDYSGGKNQGGRNADESADGRKRQDSDENFLERLYPAGTGSETGLLTFMNHVKSGKMHWIFLPYEWKLGKETASGTVRILLDLESRCAEKIHLDCELNSTKYFFVLYCNESKGKEIRFFTLPPLLPSKIKSEELRLGGFLNSGMSSGSPVTVTYSVSACSDGLCTADEEPSTVEAFA
ncbi:MAG: hypothetical protein II584_00420 [Treponema sp.]|nr:hypothetical protein [Treponema sp.]